MFAPFRRQWPKLVGIPRRSFGMTNDQHTHRGPQDMRR
jgi:hypothetical protein